ncbi:Ribonuclease G and E [Halorhabdus sp. BNX81]|nr:Ribonuclease G and E [Halorhabdus sp. BNX81]
MATRRSEFPDSMTDGESVTVRVRGIYATALTERLSAADGVTVVQASPPIQNRFETTFADEPADVRIETDGQRRGISIVGTQLGVERVRESLDVAIDTLGWADPPSQGAIFDGVVTETLGSGAVVDLGEREGFLPFHATAAHVETDDLLRVQVAEPAAPWSDDRPALETTLSVRGDMATLVREEPTDAAGPDLLDVLSVDVPDGWRVSWGRDADDADFDALEASLDGLIDRAVEIDDALTAHDERTTTGRIVEGRGTQWLFFGRESRFALDDNRRAVTPTMPGHHRIKAGDERASAAVDFVEELAPDLDGTFPFDVVTRQFGPQVGDRVSITHGKPDGRTVSLGRGEVTERDPAGTIRVEREMSPGGTYDALGTKRRAGDVAVTKFTEGKWWYPTVYRGEDGQKRGTYVNVCTPVEVFPGEVQYVDLHVDVVKHRDGTVERVDDDELDAAVGAGNVPEALAEKAREVASAVESALS